MLLCERCKNSLAPKWPGFTVGGRSNFSGDDYDIQGSVSQHPDELGSRFFCGRKLDLRGSFFEIEQRRPEIANGQRSAEANGESAGGADLVGPCSSDQRVKLFDYGASHSENALSS